MGRRILLLGPPGAGKGTQAALVSRALGIVHISTGEILRDAVAEGSDLGRRVQAIMERGDLVPDELVTELAVDRVAKPDAACGYLLDGFPRNVSQADSLFDQTGGEAIDQVVVLDVAEGELMERLLRRAGKEDRADDSEEIVRRRLDVYREQTEPLEAYYEGRGLVSRVDGSGTVEEVYSRLTLALAR